MQGAGPRPAGDGLAVRLSTEAVQAGGAEEALATNGIVIYFPLFSEAGGIRPA